MSENGNTVVTDAKGRKIEVRELRGSLLSRFTRIAGAQFGDNSWSANTLARLRVVSIDGRPTPPFPNNITELDGLWDVVDSDAASAAVAVAEEQSAAVEADVKNSDAPQESQTASGS
ncbi:hypothetical protein J2D73_18495 [Acetobacter sacchari]|uniref:Uncharacterized protein n=1 Tax=Acetobacter sacchari TaxID=2661687 RepID=A0ABS3M0Y0_9PROT|nr:hypothetical protein [Acetobacter sacchari]MBO1361775.1 hypothetical protein [Acetobacter sacchari]